MNQTITLKEIIIKANTGADAIKRAPIVPQDTGVKCLRIQDVSQVKRYEAWGNTNVSDNDFHKFQLQKGDIIVARTGNSIGCNMYIDSDLNSVFNNGLVRLRIQEEFNPRYIYYNIQRPEFDGFIKSISSGTSTQPNLQINDLLGFEIYNYSLENQNIIVETLLAFDRKISLLRRQNEILEEMAQAIFRHWFVDFEFPISKEYAESIGKPELEGRPYRRSGGEMRMGDGETWGGGEIPKGWGTGVLGNITELYDSKRIPLSSRERQQRSGKYRYYGATSVMDYVDDYLFDGVYLLLGEDGTVVTEEGYPVLQYVWGQFWVNNHAHVMKGKEFYSTEMLYLLLKKMNVSHIVTGAVQPKINQKNLLSLKIPLVPQDILIEFGNQIESLFKKIKNNSEQIQVSQKLRDTLLPKLMSGEVRI